MKALVYYVDFHSDNHQGGSGKSFEFKAVIDVPTVIKVDEVMFYIECEVGNITRAKRPFLDSTKFAIQKIEIY
jgi:hypothetical protein